MNKERTGVGIPVVKVGGCERPELGRHVAEAAGSWADSDLERLIEGESEILGLREAVDEADYLRRLVELMQIRTRLNPAHYVPRERPGIPGRALALMRRMAWTLVRPPVAWLTFKQNEVSDQLAREVEYQWRESVRETACLRERLAELERKIRELEAVVAKGDLER